MFYSTRLVNSVICCLLPKFLQVGFVINLLTPVTWTGFVTTEKNPRETNSDIRSMCKTCIYPLFDRIITASGKREK